MVGRFGLVSARLSVASVCRSLPSPGDPSSGIFVLRRLAALAAHTSLTTIQPIPYFPLLAPLPAWARASCHTAEGLGISHAPMFYVPKFFKSLDGIWLYRSVLRKLVNLKKLGKLDLVDAHFGYPEGVGAFIAARKLGVPLVVTLRGFEAEYIHKPVIGKQIRYLIRNADGCICVSHFLRDLALEHGAVSEKTRVIHNAVDKRLFFPADQTEARKKLGLDKTSPIVMSVGHLILRKRHHVLIAAFSELLRQHRDARLLVIGDKTFEPDYTRRLYDQIAILGIGDSVELLGNVEAGRIGDYLRAADVFALGTQREGCCNAVLEALACGLPVVTTPVGDNTWFVKDGSNGYIVPVDDSAAMASAVSNAILRRDWDGEDISVNLEVGDWDRVAMEVTDFFGTILRLS